MVHGAVLVSAFLIVWFVALFCLLPMGLGSAIDPDSGAPLKPQIGRKVLIATAIALVLWLAFYAAIALRLLDV